MTPEEQASHSTPMEYNVRNIPLGPDSGIYALLRQAGQAQRLDKIAVYGWALTKSPFLASVRVPKVSPLCTSSPAKKKSHVVQSPRGVELENETDPA